MAHIIDGWNSNLLYSRWYVGKGRWQPRILNPNELWEGRIDRDWGARSNHLGSWSLQKDTDDERDQFAKRHCDLAAAGIGWHFQSVVPGVGPM